MPAIDISRYPKKKTPPQNGTGKDLFAFLQKDIRLGSQELSDKKKEQFYLELSSLLQAGINLKASLELVTAEQQGKDKVIFEQLQQAIITGSNFSQALTGTAKFSLYETFSIQIGEETGKLNEVLQDLAKFYQNKIKQRRKIVSALTYPCIVLSASLGAVFFMLKFIVPMFGDIFKRFGGHLPWITEKIMALSELLQHLFLPFMLLLLSLTAAYLVLKKHATFRRISAGLLLKLPVIGGLVQKIYLARFCNSMRLLINARLPLLRAIALIRQMIRFYPLENSLAQVEAAILQGHSLHESLQRFPIFPPKMIQFIKVGEETNQLDYFFAKTAEQYLEEVEFKTATLSSVMEPLIIIFLGLIVGVILISMYLPLFQMSNSFQ